MKNKYLTIYCRILGWFVLVCGLILGNGSGVWGEEPEVKKSLPSLQQLVESAHSRQMGLNKAGTGQNVRETDIIFEAKKNYFLIQARNAQLKISKEVKGHFEKAVKSAQEKFDKGNEDISQSAITKLKLGLSGSLNDILKFEAEKDLARLELQRLLGWALAPDFKLEQARFFPPDFTHRTVQEFLHHKGANSLSVKQSPDQKIRLEKEWINLQRSRGVYRLANKNRKMTRALLVTEVANYDFGIGDEGDLFEALIIYTRLLVGYNEALYDFHLAVLNLENVWEQIQ